MNRASPEAMVGDHGKGASEGSAASRHGVLAVLAGLIALSAYGGALGLITGLLNLRSTVAGRLPFHSPVVGGLALIAVVAAPATLLAWQAARGQRGAGDLSILTGGLLAGWILVELAVIRELSFFHPIYFALGVLLIWLGIRIRAREADGSKDGS